MNKEELLYNQLYERTKEFGRTHFIKEIMRLERENKKLHNKIDKAIYLFENCKAEDYCTLYLDMYNALIGGDVDE